MVSEPVVNADKYIIYGIRRYIHRKSQRTGLASYCCFHDVLRTQQALDHIEVFRRVVYSQYDRFFYLLSHCTLIMSVSISQ